MNSDDNSNSSPTYNYSNLNQNKKNSTVEQQQFITVSNEAGTAHVATQGTDAYVETTKKPAHKLRVALKNGILQHPRSGPNTVSLSIANRKRSLNPIQNKQQK